MNVILSDGKILVDENILNKIPHFISAKHFTTEMQEYDLGSYTIEQFTSVLRYLTTGYVDLYLKTNIFDYLQVNAQPLKVNINVTSKTKYPGDSKYIIKDGYIELDNEVSYKFKMYVTGLDDYYDIDLCDMCVKLRIGEYKFTYDLKKYLKEPGIERYGSPRIYSDIHGREIKVKYKSPFYIPAEKTLFLTFSSVTPN